MITASAPKAAVLPVEEDGVDGARGAGLVGGFVTHFDEFLAGKRRYRFVEYNGAGLGSAVGAAEGEEKLVGIEVGSFGGFLHGHPEFNNI